MEKISDDTIDILYAIFGVMIVMSWISVTLSSPVPVFLAGLMIYYVCGIHATHRFAS